MADVSDASGENPLAVGIDETGRPPVSTGVVRRLLPWLLLLSGVGIAAVFWLTIFAGPSQTYLGLYKRNFIVIVGLPLAACAALALVVFLEQAQGPLEFSGLGFVFKGASGPVVLWVLCYLALVLSFKLLWVPEAPGAEPRTAPSSIGSHPRVSEDHESKAAGPQSPQVESVKDEVDRPATEASDANSTDGRITPRGSVREGKGQAGWR